MSDRVPDSFLRHLAPGLGGEDQVSALRAACERPLPVTLRVLPRAGVEIDPRAELEDRGLRLEALPFAREGYRLAGSAASPPGATLEHALGLLYVQEAASMIAGEALLRCAPPRSRLVLDLCAAPGSKTTQIARGLGDETLVVANEPTTSRLKSLVANLVRTRSEALVVGGDGRATATRLRGLCDAVLVDAPCSGEGTVRRDPKALRGWNRKRFRRFASLQTELLRAAAGALRPGGVLVYSTCALSPEENQDVVRAGLAADPELERLDLAGLFPELAASHDADGQLWVLPQHHDTGGFFVAALRRREGAGAETPAAGRPGELEILGESEVAAVESALLRPYGLARDQLGDRVLVRRGGALIAAPRAALALATRLSVNRFGPRLATRDVRGWVPDHEFLLHFAPSMRENCREVDRDLARHLLVGNAPPEAAAPESDTPLPLALRHRGAGIAFSARRGPRPISLLPRSWILPRVD